MEFRLEDFDNQQEPSIDLEGKSVEENSFGEKEKNLENSPDQIPSTMITLSLQKKKKLSAPAHLVRLLFMIKKISIFL